MALGTGQRSKPAPVTLLSHEIQFSFLKHVNGTQTKNWNLCGEVRQHRWPPGCWEMPEVNKHQMIMLQSSYMYTPGGIETELRFRPFLLMLERELRTSPMLGKFPTLTKVHHELSIPTAVILTVANHARVTPRGY